MKREPKPFVVEVKRGTRRSGFLGPRDVPEPMSDALRRAERALFAGAVATDVVARPPAAEPPGRVLQSLIEPQVMMAADDGEPVRLAPRRGRKPGSKNKPKPQAVAPKSDVSPGPSWWGSSEAGDPVEAPVAEIVPAGSVDAARPAHDHANEEHGTLVSAADPGRLRLRERSSILARYVFETEPVPGERWKRSPRRAGRGRRSLARLD